MKDSNNTSVCHLQIWSNLRVVYLPTAEERGEGRCCTDSEGLIRIDDEDRWPGPEGRSADVAESGNLRHPAAAAADINRR